MGGWLRLSAADADAQVDENGLLINDGEHAGNPQEALVTKKPNKEQQLAAMEESFRRLVDVLESLNDNVAEQNHKSEKINQNLNLLPQVLENIPQASAAQREALDKLAGELRNQSSRSQQLVEIVKDLPDLTQQQIDRLGDITQQLESSSQSSEKMSDSFSRVDESISEMLQHSQGQSISLANLGQQIQQSDQQLIEALTRQNRRMMWIFAGLAILVSAAVVVLTLFSLKSAS